MHAETVITITKQRFKMLMTLEISNKLAYSSNSTNIMIQDMNKVSCVLCRRPPSSGQVYESSFWTLKEIDETSHNVALPMCSTRVKITVKDVILGYWF